MYPISNDFIPNLKKFYVIQYQDIRHQHIHNAIFGRASQPYHFSFCKVKEGNYLLVRQKDERVLCFDGESLSMNFMHDTIHAVMVKPIKIREGAYALQVQNQSLAEKYICYDGYVLHEYYIGLSEVNSVEDAAIWTIGEVPNINNSVINCMEFALN